MPQSLAQLYIHLVFSTKNHRPLLGDDGLRREMHAFIGGVLGRMDCPAVLVGGASDHVHILSRLTRTLSVADVVRDVKRASSSWAGERAPFAWQNGYGVFSVSVSGLGRVRRYIANQEEHHRRVSFKDEFRALLRKHGVEFDERYLWD